MKRQIDKAVLERYARERDRCLGKVVEELRTKKGLTRNEVAKRANVSVLWIRRLETNQLHTNYTIGRLDQVAQALGVELYDLYSRASQMTGSPPWLNRESRRTDE
jgi:transcriptional regulator with XRE-family HTH domain